MVPYLIPLAGFAYLKIEQNINENVFHLDLESGNHDFFDGDVVIMMEMLQHISTMLWYALIMQTTCIALVGSMMKSTSAATSIRIQRYVMVMMKSTRKVKMTIAMMTTMMRMMLNGHISAKDSSPKGKKVQLRGDK